MRQMVGHRKPALVVAIHPNGAPDDAAPDAGPPPDDDSAPQTVQCPKCGCEFDPADPEAAYQGDDVPPVVPDAGDVE